MLAQRAEIADRRSSPWHVLQYLVGSPAEVDHRKRHAALHTRGHGRRRASARSRHADCAAAIRHGTTPVGLEPGFIACSSTSTAIAGSQPNLRETAIPPDAVGEDAAEHAAAGRNARDLLDLGHAIDANRRTPSAWARDIAFLLDRVATRCGRLRRRRRAPFRSRRRTPYRSRSRACQQREHFRRRFGLHGVEHARIRQRLGEGVVPRHAVDVDDVPSSTGTAPSPSAADTRVFYAVKANRRRKCLAAAKLGSCFDTRPSPRSKWCSAGAEADRISFGNTIKKERDVARAHARRALFAVDCVPEVEKIARVGAGSRVFCASSPTASGRNGRSRANSAASRDGGRRARARDEARARALRRVVPCRIAAAQSACLGPCARLGRPCSECGEAACRFRWSTSAAASRPST